LVRAWWYGEGFAYTSPGYGSDAQGNAYGANWQRVLRLPAGALLTVGAEGQGSGYRYQDTFGNYRADDFTLSGYAQYDLLLGDRTLLGLGARLDLHSTWGASAQPEARIRTLPEPRRANSGWPGPYLSGPHLRGAVLPGVQRPEPET
jgi:hypothetical protein